MPQELKQAQDSLMALNLFGTGSRLAQLVSCFILCVLSSLLSSSQQQEPRGLSHGVLVNSDHPSRVWLPNSLEGAGGGATPRVLWAPCPQGLKGRKASPDRGAYASLESLLPVGAASRAGTVLPRARQDLSAAIGMAEAFQSPSACFNYCCMLAVNSSSSLFSDCQFLVLTNPFRAGGKDGEEEFHDSLYDQKDVHWAPGRTDFCQAALHLMQTQGLRVQSSCPLTLDELMAVGSEAGADFTVMGANSIATGMRLVGIEAG